MLRDGDAHPRGGAELSDVWKCLVEGADKKEPDSSQWGPVAGQEAQSEIWEIPFKHRGKILL